MHPNKSTQRKPRLDEVGLRLISKVHYNYSIPQLYECILKNNEGYLAQSGALVCLTTPRTGRSPQDRFIVEDDLTTSQVWWNSVNQPFTISAFDHLHAKIGAYLQGREIFVQDLCTGVSPDYCLSVRIITQHAWHSLFAHNMFVRPKPRTRFVSDFTIIHVPSFKADPQEDHTKSDAFILLNFTKRLILIGGTSYAGEIKKAIFTVMNFLFPDRGVLPMHCAANQGIDGDVVIFFGLSGTGKTTLSSDPHRILIGDDEHGWSKDILFNFEGGCYAKVIRLNPEFEQEIYSAVHQFGTVLENVVLDPSSRLVDFNDHRYTENTRASYSLEKLPNTSLTRIGSCPSHIFFLTADAFGVLPPISHLTPEQAMYHFLSGYTARLAGTEENIIEPQAIFSTCFGAPFMPRYPNVYARMLRELISTYDVRCWLINTGWTGGGYGVGQRIAISHTRALIQNVIDGKLSTVPHMIEPYFGLAIPVVCPDVPQEILLPKNTWADKQAYDQTAHLVTKRFEVNFRQFANDVDESISVVGMQTL